MLNTHVPVKLNNIYLSEIFTQQFPLAPHAKGCLHEHNVAQIGALNTPEPGKKIINRLLVRPIHNKNELNLKIKP